MASKLSRREMIRNVGVAGASGLLYAGAARAGAPPKPGKQNGGQGSEQEPFPQSSKDLLRAHEAHQVELVCGDMVVGFDQRYGSISSITRQSDPLGTNYIGNEQNTPGLDTSNSMFTGDVVSTVWRLTEKDWTNFRLGQNDVFRRSGKWQRELTGKSGDARRISLKDNVLSVKYENPSSNDDGIRSYRLAMSYRAGPDSSLLWDIDVENTTGSVLEIGELGFPLMVNDDYAELYVDAGAETLVSTVNNVDFKKTPLRQKLIHEQKVLVHHFIAGHSSYALIQRPLGDAPFLMLHTTGDTSLECIYKMPDAPFFAHVRDWHGPDVLATHSWATKNLRGWRNKPWVNGHTSLILQSGEKKSYQMRFAFVPSYEAIRDEQFKAGNLGIRVVPTMVVQEDTEVMVELHSQSDIGNIDLLSDNITVKDSKRSGDNTLLTLSFKGRGQKSLKLNYGQGRWTNLHFYCIEQIDQLLKDRGKFVVDRQFYTNPDDKYHRYHGFLPFNHRTGSTFLDSDEVWEVGDSDESGFSEPLFLAEKNVYFPTRVEVDALETYVADCLFKYIQNQETYEVRASLYWKDRYPSSDWGHWTEERSKATFRSYNYVHPANIYHALYRIGKTYGLLTRKKPDEYLRMSYRTCEKLFTTGPWKHVGLMEASNTIHILEDIEKEGWREEARNLRQLMKDCDAEFVRDPYPYSSELLIDQTAHEQVYFFTRFFGDTQKNLKTIQVLKALRGGNQPVWFRYGQDKRADVCCWYNESLNGLALLQAYEDHGDPDALLKGYAGVASVMANVLPDGMGFNFFICTAGVMDHEPPTTFESGSGLWGFLKAAKSYVVKDPTFGMVGYGCRVESTPNQLTVHLIDGVQKRLRFVEEKIDIEATQGEIRRATLFHEGRTLLLEMNDSTGLAKKADLTIRGLAPGDYQVKYAGAAHRISSKEVLTISAPIAAAGHLEIKKA